MGSSDRKSTLAFKSVDKENSVFQLKMDWLYAQEIGYFAFKFVSENSEWIEPKPYLPTIEKNNLEAQTLSFARKELEKIFSLLKL